LVRGRAISEVSGCLNQLLANFAGMQGEGPEPMMNLICTYEHGLWTVYVFPRARHRPSYFFAEGDGRITVSPGAIDMAGVIVVPREEDFARVGVDEATRIFSEVSASREVASQIIESSFDEV